jgi:predicted nuclease with TOPRIM domain
VVLDEMTEDSQIRQRIGELVTEERELRERLGRGEISADEEHARLAELEAQLDQCWDLLRQRDARRNVGDDPDDARARSVDTVEDYLG